MVNNRVICQENRWVIHTDEKLPLCMYDEKRRIWTTHQEVYLEVETPRLVKY